MPYTNVRGVNINYDIVGKEGSWVALSPGGRRGIEGVASLAQRIAKAGHRVVLHDRRNCGASDVVIDGDESEYQIWADDLRELLSKLNALPAYVGGSSSGCRLSLLTAIRHPEAVRGLLLWRVTGGRIASERLAQKYYGQYIEVATKGGMSAICQTEEFSERIAAYPSNRERLMQMDPARFIAVMSHWREHFLEGTDMPVIGASASELASIKVPACIVPGNDNSHPRHVGEALCGLLAKGELHPLITQHYDMDVGPRDEWNAKEGELADIFIRFMHRVGGAPQRRS